MVKPGKPPEHERVRHPPRPSEEMHPAVVWLRSIGACGLFFGAAGMISPGYYWWAVGLVILSFVLLFIDGFLEPKLKGHPAWRISFLSIIPVFLFGFLFGTVLVPAPLKCGTFAFDGYYGDGTNMYGISWKKGMSDQRVVVENPTGHDYQNLDVYVSTDALIREVGQKTGIPGVSFIKQESPIANIHFTGNDTTGNKTESEGTLGGVGTIRMLCDKLPNHSTIEIVMAIGRQSPEVTSNLKPGLTQLDLNIPPGVNPEDVLWIPHGKAHSLSIWGQYTLLGRPHHFAHSYRNE
jgi:hypothetical protein